MILEWRQLLCSHAMQCNFIDSYPVLGNSTKFVVLHRLLHIDDIAENYRSLETNAPTSSLAFLGPPLAHFNMHGDARGLLVNRVVHMPAASLSAHLTCREILCRGMNSIGHPLQLQSGTN